MTAFTLQDAVSALTRLGCKPTKSGDQFVAFCPIHEADGNSHNPSLTLKAGNKQPVIVNCHAGCDGKEILKALGLNGATHPAASIVAVYRYTDETGALVSEKIRHEPKRFSQRYPDGNGGFVYQRPKQAPRVLYRLPEVKAAIANGRTVFVCEGEKDADRLAKLGMVATTNVEGAAQPDQAAKWRTEYTAQLSGAARVVLLPDNDAPGHAHMRHVAQQLRNKVADLRIMELPGLPAKGDVSNWLDAGHTADELKALVEKAGQPPADERQPEPPQAHDDLDAEFIPIGQFIASPPNSSYLVKGVLPASGIGQVFGNSHAGKSFVLIDLACHLALGWDWHGYKVKKTAVLYIAAEGVAGLKLRFRAWFQDHGVDPPPNLRIRTIPANLTADGATAALRERMNRLPDPPGAVFVDTLATNFGSGSENDAEDMNAAIAGLKVLMESGLLLSAHHTGHGDKTRSRGHSSLFAALDVELHVTQDADKIIRVGHTKLRDGDKLDAIVAFNLKKVSLPWADVDGDPLNSAVLVKAEHVPQCSANAERLPASQRVALDALKTALIEHGVEEKGVVSVTEEQWRQAAYSAGISGGDTDRAKRQAFQRARLDLAAKKRISIVDGRVWIPDPRGTNRNKPEHVPQCSAGESGDGEERNGTSSFKRCSAVPPQCSPTPEPNVIDSPLARRILAALDGCPGGIARADLARLVGNGKGASPAMIDTEINRLLLNRRIAIVNDRLVLEVTP